MVNQSNGKSIKWLQAVRLKIRDSHPTCKVAKKCLNVRELVELVDENKDGFLPSTALP